MDAAPQLDILRLYRFFLCHCAQHCSERSANLRYIPLSSVISLRQLSYRLETLVLIDHLHLDQFFRPFDDDNFDPTSEAVQTWPKLRLIILDSSSKEGDGDSTMDRVQYNDNLLMIAGRATRYMPRLERLDVAKPMTNRQGEIDFIYNSGHCQINLHTSHRFCLAVRQHIPSSQAVEAWRESLECAEWPSLTVKVNLTPSRPLPGSGKLSGDWDEEKWEDDWRSWEEVKD